MPVTVTVEDGSLVAGANSFVTSGDVTTYCGNRGYAFEDDDSDNLKRAVIKAGDYLRNTARFIYVGALRTATQTMPWPRDDAALYRGPDIASNVVPQCVKDAQCELAYRALVKNLQPDVDRGGRVKSEKVDVIETEYFADAPSESTITAVLGILAPVLVVDGAYPQPYLAQPVSHSPFRPDEFANPPVSYSTDPQAGS